MGKQAVKDFRAALQQRTDLQKQIRDEISHGGWDAIAFGKKLGYEFSSADLDAAFSQSRSELTPFEIEIMRHGPVQVPVHLRDLEPRGDVIGGAMSTPPKKGGTC